MRDVDVIVVGAGFLELITPDYFFLTTDTAGLMRHFSFQAERAGVALRFGEAFRPDAPQGAFSAAAPVVLSRHGLRCRWLVGADGPGLKSLLDVGA